MAIKHINYTSILITCLLLFGGACSVKTELAIEIKATPISFTPTAALIIKTSTSKPISAIPSPSPTQVLTETPFVTSTPVQTPKPTLLPPVIPNEIRPVMYNLPFGVQDSVGFIAHSGQLTFIDLSTPTAPEIIWQSEKLGEKVYGLGIVDQQVYVYSDNMLLIWDVSEPQQPTIFATFPISDYVYLDDEEAIIYLLSLANDIGNITTIDMADPLFPQTVGTVSIPWTIPLYYPFKITQRHVFLIQNGSIEIFDISDSTEPQHISSIAVDTNLNSDLEVVNNLLIVNTPSELLIIDFIAPDNVKQIGQYKNLQVDGMSIVKNTAYLFSQVCEGHIKDVGTISSGCGYGLDVVSIMNPTQPESEGVFQLQSREVEHFDGIYSWGHLMYFESNGYSEFEQQFYVLDLTTLRQER